ncbi:MAG: VCBS repeat-containing protein [Ignavibacteriales bacterium]|nr:VCBS repeat-containing protein [Ignavibacteriales bacterium]
MNKRLFLFAIIFFTTASFAQNFRVITSLPSSQSLTAERTAYISVVFNEPIDTNTFNNTTVKVRGTWSGMNPCSFQYYGANKGVRLTPTKLFSAGELVTVLLSKKIKTPGGDSLQKGFSWMFWIKSASGTLNLIPLDTIRVRQTGEGHVQTYGVNAVDVNDDGWTDVTCPNELSNDLRIFLNDGTGNYNDSFAIYPLVGGNRPSTNEGVDLNGDGVIDFAVGNTQNDKVHIFIGNGNGTFQPSVSYQAASGVRGLSVLDLESDGDFDIVTANRAGNNISILKNNGDGTFAPANNIEANGNGETACAVGDANNDGVLDVFVGAIASSEMILLLGDGNGNLVYSAKINAGGSPWKIASGDVDGDGFADVVSANSNNGTVAVIRSNGTGGLHPATTNTVGNFPLSVSLGDIDGDGDLDLVTSNYGGGTWSVCVNNGSGMFTTAVTLNASQAGSCATLHDRDNDGDLDMTGIDEEDDLIFIFDNNPTVGVKENSLSSVSFSLSQNYPNPFNPATKLSFVLGHSSFVTLKIYNIQGNEVAKVVNENLPSGTYEREWNATNFPSGMYFYRLTSGQFSETRKLLLLR